MIPTRAAPRTAQSRSADEPIQKATRSPGSIPAPRRLPAAAAIFARLRAGGRYWARVADGLAIVRTRDLTGAGWDSAVPGGRPALPTSASGNMLTYNFSNGVELTLRTSGTEPKHKYYAEAVVSGGGEEAAHAAAALLEDTLGVALREMVQPDAHGLAPLD